MLGPRMSSHHIQVMKFPSIKNQSTFSFIWVFPFHPLHICTISLTSINLRLALPQIFLYSGWNQTPSLLPATAWEALITPLSYCPPTPLEGEGLSSSDQSCVFHTASTWPPLKHTHPHTHTTTTIDLLNPLTTPMLECLNPISKLGPHPDPVSLLDPGQETEGPQIKEGEKERGGREKAAEKRCNRGGEMGWLTVRSGTKGSKSQHKPPNGSSIPRLAVYSLQGNLSTGTYPMPTDVTDEDNNTTNYTSENRG